MARGYLCSGSFHTTCTCAILLCHCWTILVIYFTSLSLSCSLLVYRTRYIVTYFLSIESIAALLALTITSHY